MRDLNSKLLYTSIFHNTCWLCLRQSLSVRKRLRGFDVARKGISSYHPETKDIFDPQKAVKRVPDTSQPTLSCVTRSDRHFALGRSCGSAVERSFRGLSLVCEVKRDKRDLMGKHVPVSGLWDEVRRSVPLLVHWPLVRIRSSGHVSGANFKR